MRPHPTRRTMLVAAAALGAACSKAVVEPAVWSTEPAIPIAVAPVDAAAPVDASARTAAANSTTPSPPRGEIALAIPYDRRVRDEPSFLFLGFAPGLPPSEQHPLGTVRVGDPTKGPLVVTEWDLATKAELHRISLDTVDGPTIEVYPRKSGAFDIVSLGYNGPLYYARLTDSFQVLTATQLGATDVFGVLAFASDEKVAALMASGIPDETNRPDDPSGLFIMSFDSAGRRIAKRILFPDGSPDMMRCVHMVENVAVIDGHVFVALIEKDAAPHVLRLTRDLKTERDRKVPEKEDARVTLDSLDGHLVMSHPDEPDSLLEFSLDLSRITRRPRPAPLPEFPRGNYEWCQHPLALGAELIALCERDGEFFLGWAPAP